MNNVTQLRPQSLPTDNAAMQGNFDFSSVLNFKAYEMPLFYKGKDGKEYGNTKHKALVRMYNDKPATLNVVRDTYKVVQNGELFGLVHKTISKELEPAALHNMRIRDKTSYMGAKCFREYIFPEVSFASPENDKIAFRIIIENGFGTGAIKVVAGAIDFYCSNGLIIGDYTSTYAKHTKGLILHRFAEAIRSSINMFWKNKHMFADLAGRKLLSDDTVLNWLKHKFGDRLGGKLFRQFEIEAKTRGRTLWAVYSALTYYASHIDSEFTIRSTENDHTASTMMKRERDVQRAVSDTADFFQLAV